MKNRIEHAAPEGRLSFLAILLIFLRMGFTSFGGPVAHLGYFRTEFVERRRWLDERAYANLVALCQLLPGPTSSQVGMALGLSKGGTYGAFAAWLGFTLPSAVLLVLFGLSLAPLASHHGTGWLHGLKLVAAAVVAQAAWNMARALCPDLLRAAVALLAAAAVVLAPSPLGQVAVIAAGGLAGIAFPSTPHALPHRPLRSGVGRKQGAALLLAFGLLLMVLPWLAATSGSYAIRLFDSFYRAGALVFGGGHVVLPMLQSQVIPAGWVSNDAFLTGYGAAQAIPGPLFAFAAYLGAISSQSPSGWAGACIALVAIFLPSFLLVIGILPFWEQVRRIAIVQNAVTGINAAVVGILMAAFYDPICTSTIRSIGDPAYILVAFLLLAYSGLPVWLVVLLGAAAGAVL